MLIEIDFKGLEKLGLDINQYLTLYKLSELVKGKDIPFRPTISVLDSLEENGYLVKDGERYIQTGLAKKLFIDNKILYDDFAEVFDLYPNKTPNGRVLRISNKERRGKLTDSYKKLYKNYIDKVKTLEYHNEVREIIKRMLIYRDKKNDLNFLNQFNVFINQKGWENYEFLLQDNSFNCSSNEVTENSDNIKRV